MKGKFVLGTSIVGVTFIIAFVHWQQIRDKSEMKKGVERDKLRLALKNEDYNKRA